MNGESFMETLQYVHERSGCTVENKILLIIYNAKCHKNIQVVECAIEYGIVLITLPSHTTDKLQPLDVSVFGPFKTFLRDLLNDRALMNPNKYIPLHLLPEFASEAWTRAGTASNILSGFRSAGIWLINYNIFPDEVFLEGTVTETPSPPENLMVKTDANSSDKTFFSSPEVEPTTSKPNTLAPTSITDHVTPGPSLS